MNLQSKVLNYLRKHPDCWVIKVEVANERGCPDILCCCYGFFLAIEIKENKGVVSPIQTEQMRRIEIKGGGEAWVVRDFEEFKKRFLLMCDEWRWINGQVGRKI